MSTAFKVVRDAAVALLLQAPQIVGDRVRNGRGVPLPEGVASDIAVNLEALGGRAIALTGAPMDWEPTYSIAMRARGSDTVNAEDAIDTVFEAVYARLAGSAPPAGVQGWVLQPRVLTDVEEGDAPIARMVMYLDVRLRTQPGSLALAA